VVTSLIIGLSAADDITGNGRISLEAPLNDIGFEQLRED